MEQQNKPTKRTARDAGLQTKASKQANRQSRYSVPNDRKTSAAPIVAVLLCAVAAVGGFAIARGALTQPTPEEPEQAIVSTQEQEQDEAKEATDNKASEKDADKKDEKETSAQKDADSSESSSDSSSDSSANSSSDTGSGSSSGSGSSASSSGSASDSATSTTFSSSSGSSSVYAEQAASDRSSAASTSSSSSSLSKLNSYFDKLVSGSRKLNYFAHNTYGPHMTEGLSVRESDYSNFKSMRHEVLGSLTDADGDWTLENVSVSSSYTSLKNDLISASRLLNKRFDIIDAGYRAINGLGISTYEQRKAANAVACKDSHSTYVEYQDLMSSISARLQ